MTTTRSNEDSPQPASPVEPDETDLVRRAQLGSVAAFEHLAVRVGPSVHRYLALRVRTDGEARDVLQETLTAAWQGLSRLDEPGKFRPWLLGIATHKAADSNRRRRDVVSGDSELEPEGRVDESVFEIREAILALRPQFRDVLLLRHLFDLSEEEVADVLGIRLGTVKSRSARARKALAESLR